MAGTSPTMTNARVVTWQPLFPDQLLQGLQAIGLRRRLVPADAVDAWKAHGDARAVALRPRQTLERHLQHQALVGVVHHLTYRTEAVDGVVPDVAVELQQLLVGEAEV